MPGKSAKLRTKAEFKHAVPITVSRPRFKLSTAFAHIDPARLSKKAQVEVDVGMFEGDGCGRTVSAVVKNGKVVQLKVAPCAEVIPVRSDPALKSLMVAARRQLGITGTPPRFRPMSFVAFQQSAGDITIKTITCVQFCIWGHCIVCCSLPQGGFFCGSRIIIHTP